MENIKQLESQCSKYRKWLESHPRSHPCYAEMHETYFFMLNELHVALNMYFHKQEKAPHSLRLNWVDGTTTDVECEGLRVDSRALYVELPDNRTYTVGLNALAGFEWK